MQLAVVVVVRGSRCRRRSVGAVVVARCRCRRRRVVGAVPSARAATDAIRTRRHRPPPPVPPPMPSVRAAADAPSVGRKEGEWREGRGEPEGNERDEGMSGGERIRW